MAKLKQHLFDFCSTFVNERINRIQQNILDNQTSMTSETKSSAGDKHETGRAMLQLEREKLGQQLAEAEKMRQVLVKVPVKSNSDYVGLGSYVRTSNGRYFLAISAGEYKEADLSIYCISTVTPIGRVLLGKSVGDTFEFNMKTGNILEIT